MKTAEDAKDAERHSAGPCTRGGRQRLPAETRVTIREIFPCEGIARMLLALIFLAGMLHGVGPDHLAAITALNAAGGSDSRRLLFFSTRFALGHAVVLAVAGLATYSLRVSMPPAWEHGFELVTAWMLLVSGAVMLLGLASGRLTVHSHPHEHSGGAHRHLHAHLFGARRHQHAHGKLAATLGGVFALS